MPKKPKPVDQNVPVGGWPRPSQNVPAPIFIPNRAGGSPYRLNVKPWAAPKPVQAPQKFMPNRAGNVPNGYYGNSPSAPRNISPTSSTDLANFFAADGGRSTGGQPTVGYVGPKPGDISTAPNIYSPEAIAMYKMLGERAAAANNSAPARNTTPVGGSAGSASGSSMPNVPMRDTTAENDYIQKLYADLLAKNAEREIQSKAAYDEAQKSITGSYDASAADLYKKYTNSRNELAGNAANLGVNYDGSTMGQNWDVALRKIQQNSEADKNGSTAWIERAKLLNSDKFGSAAGGLGRDEMLQHQGVTASAVAQQQAAFKNALATMVAMAKINKASKSGGGGGSGKTTMTQTSTDYLDQAFLDSLPEGPAKDALRNAAIEKAGGVAGVALKNVSASEAAILAPPKTPTLPDGRIDYFSQMANRNLTNTPRTPMISQAQKDAMTLLKALQYATTAQGGPGKNFVTKRVVKDS